MIECCTGLQESEEELRMYLKKHPEQDKDIFNLELSEDFSSYER